ncbi:MAG TPA: PTS sugar transporter subunit IIA [Polyangiaceae bacterium]
MKLTVHEAAKLLNTTERTIYRWIRDGSIPCRRINDHYRFHRSELLEWATARGMVTAVDAFPPSRTVSEMPLPKFAAALHAGGVHHHVEATDRETALRAVVKRMPLEDEGDRELLLDVMLARESLGSTGIGDGIAIPHVRSPIILHTREPSITLCFLEHPIDFQAIDGRPVHTFFSLVTLTIRSHLYLLSRLSASLQDPKFKRAVVERAPGPQILAEATRVDLALGNGTDKEDAAS